AGACVTFDGTNDQVFVGRNALHAPAQITVSSWVKLNSYGEAGDAYIAGVVENYTTVPTNQTHYSLRVGSDGTDANKNRPAFIVRIGGSLYTATSSAPVE